MTSNNISQLELDWYAHDLEFDIAEYVISGLKNPHPSGNEVLDMVFQKAISTAVPVEPFVPSQEPEVHPSLVDWVLV